MTMEIGWNVFFCMSFVVLASVIASIVLRVRDPRRLADAQLVLNTRTLENAILTLVAIFFIASAVVLGVVLGGEGLTLASCFFVYATAIVLHLSFRLWITTRPLLHEQGNPDFPEYGQAAGPSQT